MKIKRVLLTALPIVVGIIVTLIMTACSGSSGSKLSGPNNETTTIAGKVLNAQQVPMPFAEIELYKSDNAHKVALADKTMLAKTSGALRASGLGNDFTTRANEAGEFAFSDIPAGEYTLRAQLGDGQQFLKTRLNTNTAKEGMVTLNVTLTPTGGASGVVTYLNDPVKNAVMYLDGTKYVTITDAEGKYSFSNVPMSEEPYIVKVLEIPVGKHGEYLLYNHYEPSIEIEKGGDINIPLIDLFKKDNKQYSYKIKGKLAGEGFESQLKDRLIIALNTTNLNSPYAEIYYANTDNDGEFIVGVDNEGEYFVSMIKNEDEVFTPAEFAKVTVTFENTSANPKIVPDFVLTRGFIVSGVAKVNLEISGETGEQEASDFTILFESDENVYITTTDQDGRFSISLPQGTYQMRGQDSITSVIVKGGTNSIVVTENLSNLELDTGLNFTIVTCTAEDTKGNPIDFLALSFINEDDPNVSYSVLFMDDESIGFMPSGTYKYSINKNLMPFPYKLEDDPAKNIEDGIGTVTIQGNVYDLGTVVAFLDNKPKKVSFNFAPVSKLASFETLEDRSFIVERIANDFVKIRKIYSGGNEGSAVEINSSNNGGLSGIQEVSTAIYNGHLFVMVSYAEPAETRIYKFDPDLHSRVDYDPLSNLNGQRCSLFATNLGLYAIAQSPSEPEAKWYKIPFNDPTFNAGNDDYYFDHSHSAGLTHIMPCHDQKYIYLPVVDYAAYDNPIGIKIYAYNKLLPLIRQSPSTVAELSIPDGINLGNASIHLSCANDRVSAVMYLGDFENYFAQATHNPSGGPDTNAFWSTIPFTLEDANQIFANDHETYKFDDLKAQSDYSHLKYPLHRYGSSTNVLFNPIRIHKDTIYVLGSTGSDKYDLYIFDATNWPQ